MNKNKSVWTPETQKEIDRVTAMGESLVGNINEIRKKNKLYFFDIDEIPDEWKPKTQYVWVTFDPLHEKVLCVHKKHNSECDVCRPIRAKREGAYFLNTLKFKVKD